ncbi:sterol desaturase family protein [Micromonospora sp. WMMC250]|uniref:sterol desaturase family protein n=1 Tax=Micromonospora sp. WMMC250 TaxID=3014781 RepID=UPI0022B60208|nr:sterol desaturase family protein [Micromonospora sp. WMMC250]MCZ7379876.1 sterol desaturase family protein [Micromonospora sp. WMMC250]
MKTRTSTHPFVASALRYGYAPVMLLGVNGAGIAVAEAGAPKLWLLVLLAAAVALSFAVERLIPYTLDWNTGHDDAGRDRLHAIVNETLILASVAAIPLLAATVPTAALWPTRWPFALQVLGAILVADLGITLVHYASHHIGALWRFHAVHHSVRRMYGLNGLMKHPLHQTIEMTAGVAPLILLGLPVNVASALALAVAVQLLLQHSNADYRVGPLTYLLALNEGHRFHHLKWAGVGDVNFGLFTLLWDHALGTFSYDPQRRFTTDDLGMAAKPHYPHRYWVQLIEPFKRSGACHSQPSPAPLGRSDGDHPPQPAAPAR